MKTEPEAEETLGTVIPLASRPEARPIAASAPVTALASLARDAGLGAVNIVGWRDLDDAEAGGSELHAATIARLWAAAGIAVTMRTSSASGHPAACERDGYQVVRKAGRYAVFARTPLSHLLGRTARPDGLVEIWNGMPFFSPVWARCARVVFLHHVHAEMWRMVIRPRALARVGEAVEFRLAPPFYRRARIVTLSESSRQEIVDLLGLPEDNVTVVPPGVDPRFSPGGERAPRPLVVAVGRLVPVKRFDLLIEALARLRGRHRGLEAVIVGEGYERRGLEASLRAAGAERWLHLPGYLSPSALVDLYRRAWVLASSSAREGWGMTITEAGACATPSVVTRIAGHLDAVVDGHSGLLASDLYGLIDGLDAVLSDAALRARLGRGAEEQAARYTWEATARGTLEALAAEAVRRHG
ncbi:MAG TPA: glycosyltransferase family 4 protein [Acidimicrobiales bacterium]|nr:glycosyltransferase family 4 protein [Acidimicrobiales bacterium]